MLFQALLSCCLLSPVVSAPGLDYKKLTDGQCDPLTVLRPVLSASNVTVLAKLMSRLPSPSGGYLSPSVVYCAWATHCFWSAEGGQAGVGNLTSAHFSKTANMI